MSALLRYWLQFKRLPVAQFLLPCHCALCLHPAPELLCEICHQRYFSHHPARCSQCGIASEQSPCAQCLLEEPAYDATIVASDYLPPIDQLVLALKFGHRLAHAPLFARLLRDALLHTTQTQPPPMPTLLLPVPLSRLRLRERGFNQALEIARPLAQALGVPLQANLLLRVRDTPAQSLLSNEQRADNLQQAFALTPTAHEAIIGQHIGLVDDVMTTGSTLNELAATLKRYGAVRVSNWVFARTPKPNQTPQN
jgi:ComF family protein